MSAPKISVLLSCYNGSRWLQEAIDSALTQTFTDFELILVDDGSTDETWNIIQRNCGRDKRVVGVSKENSGLADSLNVGLARARGAWIARLDDDDLCEPSRLEEQVKFVDAHPEVVLLGTGFSQIDAEGRFLKKLTLPSGHCDLLRHMQRLRPLFPHSSAFYRADAARRANGYDVRFRRSQDFRLWFELASMGRIACLPEALVRIREHPGQVSQEAEGRDQIRYGTAAAVCYSLRVKGGKDPSASGTAEEWTRFLEWLGGRIEARGVLQRRRIWADARASFFSANNKLAGAVRFGTRLLLSGQAGALVWGKCFGSRLPSCLANEWMRKSRAAGTPDSARIAIG